MRTRPGLVAVFLVVVAAGTISVFAKDTVEPIHVSIFSGGSGGGVLNLPDGDNLNSLAARSAAAIGKPPALSWHGSWITSDAMPNEYTTSWYWCDFESTVVFDIFYAPTIQTTVGSTRVYTTTGALIYANDTPFTPGAFSYYYANVGYLPSGWYKVVTKVKQGAKSITTQFWTAVFPSSDALCQPAAARFQKGLGVPSEGDSR